MQRRTISYFMTMRYPYYTLVCKSITHSGLLSGTDRTQSGLPVHGLVDIRPLSPFLAGKTTELKGQHDLT